MLIVSIKKDNNIIEELKFSGHAKYDDYGKDIVCASASTMMLTTVNAIIEFDNEAIDYSDKEDIIITNIKKDSITNTLLSNLEKLFRELENQYKENIKIIRR